MARPASPEILDEGPGAAKATLLEMSLRERELEREPRLVVDEGEPELLDRFW